jgi:hypothetical protein
MFSIDQLLAPPPFSFLFSIFLLAGFDLVGLFGLRYLGVIDKSRTWIRWQAPIFGAMLFAIALYPLALLQITPRFFMQIIAIFCMIGGVMQIFYIEQWHHIFKVKLKTFSKLIRSLSIYRRLTIIILVLMGFTALGPETSADGLDYHLGVAISILNNGGIPLSPEWFSSRLSGNGEVINALSMSIGAEQFGSLLQYISLLATVSLILCSREIDKRFYPPVKSDVSDIAALAAVSAPVLLFLISSSKPQMWPIAMTTFAFILLVHPSRYNLPRSKALINYAVICLLIMTASQTKFNFILSGSLLGLFAFIQIIKRRYFFSSIFIPFIAAFFVIAPPIIWKASVFNSSWLDALITLFPGNLPGTAKMEFVMRHLMNGDSKLPFPLSILIPTNIGSFSSVLGFAGLIFIGLRPGKNLRLWLGIIVILFIILGNICFAPQIGRMYLEPYFWLLIILVLQSNSSALSTYTFLKWPILLQAFIVIIAAGFGAISLFPGALLSSWRTNIMEHFANGYEIMQWADKILPKDAILLNQHRSMALSPRDSVSYEWAGYVDFINGESEIYLNRLKNKNISHILIIGPINYAAPLANCFGDVLAGPGIGHVATRNPFNQGQKYEAWILKFEGNRLPNCALQHTNVKY